MTSSDRPGSTRFVDGLLWLTGFWLVGELLVRLTGLPVPGAVAGMLLLFVALQVRRPAATSSVLTAADGLLSHLQLLFIPAGVGIVAVLATVRDAALPLAVAFVVSWVVGLVLVGWTVTLLLPRADRGRRTGEPDAPGGAAS